MKSIFQTGDQKTHHFTVKEEEVAAFADGVVHPVCSTFALGREMEWSSRLFVLEMKEEDEEGIGTMLEIEHKSPALVGEEVEVVAEISELNGNELICSIEVKVEDRLVATGRTGQKILKKEKITRIFSALK